MSPETTEHSVNLIAELLKVGPVVTVLLLVVRFLWVERKELKQENKELQDELKQEIKASTAFAAELKAFIENLKP